MDLGWGEGTRRPDALAPWLPSPAHLLWEAETWYMLAFALIANEADFFVQFFNQRQLVASIQFL